MTCRFRLHGLDARTCRTCPPRGGTHTPNEQRLRGVCGQRMVVADRDDGPRGVQHPDRARRGSHAAEMAPDADLVHRAGHQAIPGTVFRRLGDGLLAYFPSAREALDCLIETQRGFANQPQDSSPTLQMRGGINWARP